MKILTILLLVALAHTVVMSVAAITAKHQNVKARYMFAAMMLGFSGILVELALFHEKSWDLYVYAISFSGPLITSVPIFFFLYLRASLRFNSRVDLGDIKHFIVPLIYVAMMTPFNFLDVADRREFFTNLYSGETISWYLSLTPVRFTRLGLFAVLGVFYLQLTRHEFQIDLNHKKSDVLKSVKKLKIIFLAMSASVSLIFLFFIFRLPHSFTWVLSSLVIVIIIIISLLFIYLPVLGRNWKTSAIVEKEPIPEISFEPAKPEQVKNDDTTKASSTDKRYRSSVTESVSSNIKLNLYSLLEAGIYKDSTLSLKKLASELNVSTHHLSQIINEKSEGNYFDLVNSYRIDGAKKLIRETDFSMIDIAYEVGFNSKSTFYTEFKRRTDKTPSQYKKSILPG